MGATTADPELRAVEIHDVLSNERRQLILKFLRDGGGLLTARELSERIAEVETGETPPPRNIRQSAYVSLHQTHLPKLDELDIVDYDQSAKTVELNDRAREVSVYMETVPKYGISWSEYYVAVSVLGLLLIIAGEIGVPVLASIGSLALASATFVLILASATYQTYSQQSSVLHRLRE
jgi:DNA-binding transcriptional ArsR family regulator